MDKTFNVNHPLLFILAGAAILFVALQSIVFLRKAWKRALEKGYSKEQLKKTAVSSAVFSIAPAVAIGIGIITLAPSLGTPLPWLRLSVIGAIMYELTAAETAASAMGVKLGEVLTATQFSTIAWTMTVGIATGLVLVPLLTKRTLNKISSTEKKSPFMMKYFSTAIFIGLVATFVGVGVSEVLVNTEGLVSALVLLTSAVVIAICGVLKAKLKWDWLNDYALPICMIIGMASAILYQSVLS